LSASALRADSFSSPSGLFVFYIELLIANFFSLGVCAVWVLLFAKTLFRDRDAKPIPFFFVLTFSASLGALKGIVTGFMIWVFQIEPDLGLAISSRVWQTAILGIWLVPALALVAHQLEKLQIQRGVLIAERVNFLVQGSEQNGSSNSKDVLSGFTELAKAKLSQSTDLMVGADQNKRFAQAIRNLVNEELRPLSHRIWLQENKRYSNFSLGDISRRAIFDFPSTSLLVALVYMFTAFPTVARYTSWDQALGRVVVAAVLIFAVLKLSSLWKPRRYWHATIWFIAVTLIATMLAFYSGEFVFGFVDGFRLIESLIATWLWVVQLTFLGSFLLDVQRNRKSLESELSVVYGLASIDKDARFSQARIQNRDLANFLHGQVQNKLLGIALNLEKAKPTQAELEQALKSVSEVFEGIDSELDLSNSGNLAEGVCKLKLQWQGFVEIESLVDPSADDLSVRDRVFILQVIEEAIANSVRHGLSKNINVALAINAGRPTVEVSDDGIGPRDGRPGLGSNFFDSVSKGNWSLESLPAGGSKLTVTL
jgi:two-component sensor histidine kinase